MSRLVKEESLITIEEIIEIDNYLLKKIDIDSLELEELELTLEPIDEEISS